MKMVPEEKIQNIAPKKKTNKYYLLGYNETKKSLVTIKTLILNGSPRKNGDTAFLIQQLTDQLHGEIKIVNAYTANISPYIDYRKCREKFGCAIKDEMQEVYQYLEICDNVIFASPIYFPELIVSLILR